MKPVYGQPGHTAMKPVCAIHHWEACVWAVTSIAMKPVCLSARQTLLRSLCPDTVGKTAMKPARVSMRHTLP